jgi:hypothetical protein
MRRSQRSATESPRPADIATIGDEIAAADLPRFEESQPDYDQVARRAYERYEARGREDGRDIEDWLEAERELRRSSSPIDTARASASGVRVRQ